MRTGDTEEVRSSSRDIEEGPTGGETGGPGRAATIIIPTRIVGVASEQALAEGRKPQITGQIRGPF